jgi:hypothetical protein
MTEPNQTATEDAPQPIQVFTLLESLGLPEDTPAFTATKPVQAQQLEAEIKAASDASRVEITYSDMDVQDEEHPVTIYVIGAKSKKSVNDAITAHQADPQYGLSQEQKDRAEALALVQDPNANPTVEQLTTALRALLTPIDPGPVDDMPTPDGGTE